MFSNKKTKKLDPKIRFQHKQFTGKLQTARSYKRAVVAVPETNFEKFLNQIGLGSRITQVALGIIVLGLIYLIYFPNFLSLKNITVTGLSESQARDLEIALRDEIAESNFFIPQRNLLFFQNELVDKAVSKLPSVASANKVTKKISNQEIFIEAQSKYEKFLILTPDKVLDVYEDGILKGEADVKKEDWTSIDNPNMIKIELLDKTSMEQYSEYLHKDLVNYLTKLDEKIKNISGSKVAYYKFKETKSESIEPVNVENLDTEESEEVMEPIVEEPKPETSEVELPINSSEVHAVVYKPDGKQTYRIIFDTTKDPQKSIDNLKLLLSQTTPERMAQLSYIDLRLEERAYLCLQGAVCDK